MKNNIILSSHANIDELLIFANDEIEKMYYKYEYLSIPKKFYYHLVKKEISNIEYVSKSDSFIKVLRKKLDILFNNDIKEKLLDEKNSYSLIYKYIDQYFIKDSDNLLEFDKLNKLLKKGDFIPNPDLISNLIEYNDLFNNSLKLIYIKYKKYIENNKFDSIINNDFLSLSISIYCMINRINISSNNDIDTDVNMSSSYNLYMKELRNFKLLSLEEEKELGKRLKTGDKEARKKFIESNLKLVISIAKQYANMGLPYNDLIQEGNIGLIKAVDKFDVDKGYKFSCYAFHWIKHSITRALGDKSRMIRLPIYFNEMVIKYNKAVSSLSFKLERMPTLNEVAQELKISLHLAKKISMYLKDSLSIEELKNEDNEDYIPINYNLEDDISKKTLRKNLDKLLVLSELSDREIEILKLRAGYYGNKPMTLESIGKKNNMSKQAVNGIEQRALSKIRNCKYVEYLIDYLDEPSKALKRIEDLNVEYRKKQEHNNYVSKIKRKEKAI